VLTKKPFIGPYYITNIIQGDDTIGPSYRLVEVATGKPYRYLVSGDRLKRYDVSRADLRVRIGLPVSSKDDSQTVLMPQSPSSDDDEDKISDGIVDNSDDLEPAIKILKQRMRQKKPEYLVLFCDKSKYWCSYVTDALLQQYRLSQQRHRERQRLRRQINRRL